MMFTFMTPSEFRSIFGKKKKNMLDDINLVSIILRLCRLRWKKKKKHLFESVETIEKIDIVTKLYGDSLLRHFPIIIRLFQNNRGFRNT